MFNYLKVLLSPPFSYHFIYCHPIFTATQLDSLEHFDPDSSQTFIRGRGVSCVDVLLTWVTDIRHLSQCHLSLFILI